MFGTPLALGKGPPLKRPGPPPYPPGRFFFFQAGSTIVVKTSSDEPPTFAIRYALFMCTLLLALVLGVATAAPLRVLVDPGHGGKDHGATRAETLESDITLKVARLLHAKLSHDPRFESRLTRAEDMKLTLSERAQIAAASRAQIFVSVHVNSNPDHRAHGVEFYFQNQLPSDQESMYLAHRENEMETGQARTYEVLRAKSYSGEVSTILTDLLDGDRIVRSARLTQALKSGWRATLNARNAPVRQAPFYVLSQLTIPSALVELGFLTNEQDYRDLVAPATQSRMAEALYRGLIRYRESITNGHAP